MPDSGVTENFKAGDDNLVSRVKMTGEWVDRDLLIEGRSKVDRDMAVRILCYVGLQDQDPIKRGDVLRDGRLPPIVLCNAVPLGRYPQT